MKKIFLCISVAAVLMACKKYKTADEPTETVYKIKTSSVTNATAAPVSVSYEYDAQNRLIKYIWSGGPRRTEYVHSNSGIIEKIYNSSDILSETKTHELNSSGLVAKTTYSSSPGYYIMNSYNARKQLLSTKEYNVGGMLTSTSDYFYNNHSLDSVVWRTAAGVVIGRLVCTYSSNINNSIGNQHYGLAAFGRGSVKAASKKSYYNYDYSTGALVSYEEQSNSYETDAQGRIIKLTISNPAIGGSSLYQYNYY